MADEKTVTEEEKAPEQYVLTDEMRNKARQRPLFNILYIGEGQSRLSLFRGEPVLRSFASYYARYATINYMTITPAKALRMDREAFKEFNVVWIDNSVDVMLVRHIGKITGEMRTEQDPDWVKKCTELNKEDPSSVIKYIDEVDAKRREEIRFVYALDEFVWEGPVGRAFNMHAVTTVETFLQVCDVTVLPTEEMRDIIDRYGFIPPGKEMAVVPTAINHEFHPIFRNFTRKMVVGTVSKDKPKVLVKGITLGKNVEEFIAENYTKFDITICTIEELTPEVMSLIERKRIRHINHWANPVVNQSNISMTYALERDLTFDFLVYCAPEVPSNGLYEITVGDDDVLFAIASGILPVCKTKHIGYPTQHLYNASGLVFDPETPASEIASMISEHGRNHYKFNEAFKRCKSVVDQRTTASPHIMGNVYAIMLGKELATAKDALMKEERAKALAKQEADTKASQAKTEPPVSDKETSDDSKVVKVDLSTKK